MNKVDASFIMCKTLNSLNVNILGDFINHRTKLNSQSTLISYNGFEILSYLNRVITFFVEQKISIQAEMGELSFYEPCVLLNLGNQNKPNSIYFFEVYNDNILQISHCLRKKTINSVERTGIYPE